MVLFEKNFKMISMEDIQKFSFNDNVFLICIFDHISNFDEMSLYDKFFPFCKTLIASRYEHTTPCHTCYLITEDKMTFEEWSKYFDHTLDPTYHFNVYAELKDNLDENFDLDELCKDFYCYIKRQPFDFRIAMWYASKTNSIQYNYNIMGPVLCYFNYVYEIDWNKLAEIALRENDFTLIEEIEEFFHV